MNTRQQAFLLVKLLLWSPPVVYSTWDPKFLLNYIFPITSMMGSLEINWFISERLSSRESADLQQFMVTIHSTNLITQTVITNNTAVRVKQTENKRNYLGIVMTTGPDDYIMTVHDKVLKGRHFYLNFVILVSRIQDFKKPLQILQDLNRRNFHNTYLYVGYRNGSSDLYGLTSFPQFTVELRTDLISYIGGAMAKYMYGGWDCMGFKYLTPLRQDVPFVFRYRDRHGKLVWKGSSYVMMELFMEYVNASMVEYEMPKDSLGGEIIDMRAALDLIRKDKVLLLAHSYALFTSDDYVEISYPIMVVRWCLMVPIWNTVSTFYYLLKPFDKVVWYAVLFTFWMLSFADCLWIWVHSRINSRGHESEHHILIWHLKESFMENFCYIINIAASRIIRNPPIMRFLFYAAVWFHGFFLTANYTSLLGSILTVTLFREQINTMEDQIRVNLSVMIIDYEYEFLVKGGLNLPLEFLNLLTLVDTATFSQHQISLNKSYAYFVTDDKWRLLNMQQKNLKYGLFKLTDICFGSYYLGYPIEPDSPIERTLEYFMRSMHSSGLLMHYENMAFDNAVQAGFMKNYHEEGAKTTAQMEHISMVFFIMILTYIISFGLFVMEIIVAVLQRQRQKRMQ
ncbi:uncharacterized protein [Musca autumnalis]|uniref:uncharacterized protein n=1 Tax=Musca autumnalis TaxID=221902 RepID=UPI003CF87004